MIIKIYPKEPNRKEIDKIVTALRNGAIIIYPTDTLYAIGCDALNIRAVEKICIMKGTNPQKNNFSIICHDLSSASEFVKIDNKTFKLIYKNLPGPFTFILNTSGSLPKLYKNRKCIGIRIPDNNIVREIAKELGNPLMTSSLIYREGDEEEYFTDPELIDERWGEKVQYVIDGGEGEILQSTVVDCTGEEPLIIRQGKGELKQ